MDKIPIGLFVQDIVNKIVNLSEYHFRNISDVFNNFLGKIIDFLEISNPILLVSILLIITFIFKRNLKTIVLIIIGALFIFNLGYWRESLETLTLVIFSTTISALIGIPLGILCAHHPFVYYILRPILDLMQTIPTFVYLIPTLMLFGLGMAPGLFSTIIFAMPATIRLTYLGISKVPPSLLEVADAFGASKWKKLISVEFPSAKSSILTGISQCVMLSLSMVVIAALVGAEGLGKPVVQALNTVNIVQGFEAGISIVIIAILLDRILSVSKNKKTGEVT
ncbi:ABC transporter permease [Pigmentibacter ruber]|nr:choline ABC transporter permease subunit [Pigmentibacter ruber]